MKRTQASRQAVWIPPQSILSSRRTALCTDSTHEKGCDLPQQFRNQIGSTSAQDCHGGLQGVLGPQCSCRLSTRVLEAVMATTSLQLQPVFQEPKGCHGSLQVALNPLHQDFRESYINAKLLKNWRRGEAWAALDLQGIALSEQCRDTTLVSLPPADRHPMQQLTGLPVRQQMCSAMAGALMGGHTGLRQQSEQAMYPKGM